MNHRRRRPQAAQLLLRDRLQTVFQPALEYLEMKTAGALLIRRGHYLTFPTHMYMGLTLIWMGKRILRKAVLCILMQRRALKLIKGSSLHLDRQWELSGISLTGFSRGLLLVISRLILLKTSLWKAICVLEMNLALPVQL